MVRILFMNAETPHREILQSRDATAEEAAGILSVVKEADFVKLHEDDLTNYMYEWSYFKPEKNGGYTNCLEIYVRVEPE